MSKKSIALNISFADKDGENIEENHEDKENVSSRTEKLLKMMHIIKKLRKEALVGYSKGLEELKSTCDDANALLGELNGKTGGKQNS